jgi:subtilisin family serine protease
LLTAGGAGAQSQPAAYETVVVQLSSPAVHASSVLGGLPGSGPKAAPHNRYWLRVPVTEAASVVSRLQHDSRVSYATVSRPVHATASPNDPCYTATCLPPIGTFDSNGNMVNVAGPVNQDYLKTVGAPAAWDISKGDGQVVAVLDSGVDQAHPDLAGKVRNAVNVCGSDPACGDPNNTDDNGHGTHVSGIIAADTNNNTGVASLGWNLSIDMYKVLDQDGNGLAMDVATAIYDAVDAGDRVINMSLANYSCAYADSVGHPELCGPDSDEERAVEYALAHNVVVVAAAGNDGYDSPTYPASYPGVLSVAATDNSGTVLCFSQWGSSANIAAPGKGIVSTWNGSGGYNYFVLDGTSMAAPQVSAAAGLMIAHNSALTGAQITELLEDSASPTGGNGGCGPANGSQPPATHSIYGGLLNVPAGLQAESNPPQRFSGYDMAGSNGSVYPFGNSFFAGDTSGTRLNQPVVDMARTADGGGYWLVARDGGIFSFGNAHFYGSTGAIRLNKPIVGMAEDPATGGYWLVAADGGIFSFNAPFYGSTGAIHLNQPVVGMGAMPDGSGYWLVAADGGIFTFGNAHFFGSTGAIHLNKPVVGMSPTTSGQGYWLVASDGGIFTFGDAGFYGSTGAIVLNRPIVSMATTPSGHGYWLFASDGGVFTFGDARFYGSLGATALPAPVVAGSD